MGVRRNPNCAGHTNVASVRSDPRTFHPGVNPGMCLNLTSLDRDLNPGPSDYETDALPNCAIEAG